MQKLLEHKTRKNKRILARLADQKILQSMRKLHPSATSDQIHAAIYLDDFWDWLKSAKTNVISKMKQVYQDNKD